MDRLINSLNNHKYIKKKNFHCRNNFIIKNSLKQKAIKLKFSNKSFGLIMTYLLKQPQNKYLFVYQILYTTSFIFVK